MTAALPVRASRASAARYAFWLCANSFTGIPAHPFPHSIGSHRRKMVRNLYSVSIRDKKFSVFLTITNKKAYKTHSSAEKAAGWACFVCFFCAAGHNRTGDLSGFGVYLDRYHKKAYIIFVVKGYVCTGTDTEYKFRTQSYAAFCFGVLAFPGNKYFTPAGQHTSRSSSICRCCSPLLRAV